MNKSVRKVKLIYKNVLAAVVYYFSFNPLYLRFNETVSSASSTAYFMTFVM